MGGKRGRGQRAEGREGKAFFPPSFLLPSIADGRLPASGSLKIKSWQPLMVFRESTLFFRFAVLILVQMASATGGFSDQSGQEWGRCPINRSSRNRQIRGFRTHSASTLSGSIAANSVNREEFLSRHAEIAGPLRSFFAAEEPLRQIAATKLSEETAGISTRSLAAQGQETVPPKPNADRPLGSTGSGLAGQFGRYQIIRALGNGAMGTVYLAEDTHLERLVAT